MQDNITQVDAASVYTLPAGADFLMCYSVAEGEWAECRLEACVLLAQVYVTFELNWVFQG